MEVDVPSLISWLLSGDRELQLTSLEYLCNALLFANDRGFVDKLDTPAIISALLLLFSEDNTPDDVLELNARTLLYLLEMLDPSALQNIRVKHYKVLCMRLDIADLSSPSSSELAQRIIKLLDFITSIESEKPYLGGVLSSVLRFVRWHSEEVHADVVQSGMNIIHELCRRCEPGDENISEWMESLTDLLSHNNYDVVVKKALQSLGCIFERFSSSGQDLSSIATNELITRLSHHLYKACGIFPNIRALGLSLFYYPSFLEFMACHSPQHEAASLNEDDPEAFTLEGKPDLILANSLTNVLLTLFYCSSDATQHILSRENYLAFSLISLLRNCQDDGMLTSVFRLLQVIVLKLGHETPALPDVQLGAGDGEALGECSNGETEDFMHTLTSFCSFRAAIEAIKGGDNELVKRLLSDGLDLKYTDNHGQNLLDWAVFCGTPEVVETICSLPDVELTLDLTSALSYAAAFGRGKVCRILLRHGADPNAVGKDGLRPIDRAEAVKPLGGREVIELLKGYASKGREGSPVSLQRKSPRMLPIYRSEAGDSVERQLFILATEIFPGLVDVFEQTQSESVKYQAVLILLQLVSRLSSKSLQIINTYPFGISLAFRLSQMIFMALAEEAEKTLHCVFQLCHQLLSKSRSIYLPLMHRVGIIPLIRSIDSVMQLPHFRFTSENDYGGYYYPIRETPNEEEGEDSDVSTDSTVDFIPNENKGENDGTNSEFSEADDIVAEDNQGQTGEEQQNEADPKNPSSAVTLTESEIGSGDEPYPLSSACSDEWQGWNIVIFGNFLFIYNDGAVVLFDINREDNILCGLYLTSSRNRSPVEFRGEMELADQSIESLRYQMLYLTRQLMNSRDFAFNNKSILQWPLFYVEDPTMQRKRPQSMSRRRPDSRPHHRRRSKSAPSRSSLQVPGKEFEEYTRIRTDQWKMPKQPSVVRAGNLLLDIVQTESELPLLRVRPKGASDDAFLFSTRPNQGFFKLRACADVASIFHKIMGPLSETKDPPPIIIGMDGRIWLMNSSSGRILASLFTEDSKDNSVSADEKQLTRFKMHHLASRMLSHDLASKTSPDSDKPLPSAPPKCATARTQALDEPISSVNTINTLSEIAATLGNAHYRTSKQAAIADLSGCFTRLVAIFSTGEETVTSYELSSSGLVSSLLICLSSSSCTHWSGVVNSNDSHHHLEFLLQRRRTFLRIFEGNAALPALIRCLLNILDQIERLPIHLFDEIFYPTSSDQLKHEVTACMEALSSASPSTVVTAEMPSARSPRSCRSNSSSCFDFTGFCRSTGEEYSQVLPLGLISPPLPSASDYHSHLTGGGVRGLVDRQVLLLLGAWFPDLHTRLCTGTVGTPQVQEAFTIIVKRRLNATREIRVGSGKGRPLFLSHGFPRGRPCFMPSSTEHCLRGVTLVKEWYQCPRRSMRFLREFWKKPSHAINLIPEVSTSVSKDSDTVELPMGLFEWMGTYGGTVENWVNPCQCGLVTAVVFHPSSSEVICDGSLAFEQNVKTWEGSQSEEDVVAERDGINSFDSCILNGEEVGARLTIEIGLQLVPTAYRLSILRNEGNGLAIRSWCLQASNDGKRWTTLSVHKDSILNGISVTIPLCQRNFRLWSKPLCGDANTSALTRPLSVEAVNEAFNTLNIASVSTPEVDAEESDVVLSFHIFRIMDLTALPKQSNLIVKGFELFGTVIFAHPSLLTQEKLAGLPVRFRSQKTISTVAPVTDPQPDSLISSAPAQPGNPTHPFPDIGQNPHFPANEDVHAPLSVPQTSAQAGENAHLSVERRALEFAEAIDALIASNILRDMNESLTSLENQPSLKRLCDRDSPGSRIISDLHTEAPRSENSFFNKASSEILGKLVGETTARSVFEAQSGQKLESEETGMDAVVDLTPLPPSDDLRTTGFSASSGSLTTAELYMLNQMSAIREGRKLNQLDLESGDVMFPLVPGLIPNFDPNAPQARPSSSNFHLRISPDCMLSPEFFYQKKKEYDLRMELFARRKDDSVAASVYIDDPKAPIFKYILRLAENTLYSEINGETTADGLPLVEISLEYSFCTPRDESKYDEHTSQSTSLLTSRDVRLIGAQEKHLERLGIHPPKRMKRSTKERTEELLELLQLLAKLTGVSDVADEGRPNGFSTINSNPSISARDFVSFSLSRKLTRQLQDILAVAAGPALPDWCMNLTQRVTALFPYNIRYHFFRACAFGPARSLLWLQSNATPSQSINEDYNDQRRLVSYLQHTTATRFAANLSSHLNHTDCDLGAVETSDEFLTDVDSFARNRAVCDCHMQTIGRPFRNFIDVPRDESVDPSGRGFWAWAERVMDEHAACKSELEIRFTNEEGTGLGPTLEFFSLLALEFRRKSLGMWLVDSCEQVESPAESNLSSDCINPSFGLFPTPYPRNSVPLNILRRFYIMGIAVAKALQDKHLMDLPLSTPFLKLLACYGSLRQTRSSTDVGVLEAELNTVIDAETSRERILLAEDPLFMERHGKITGSSRHWLTGLLDFEDFAHIQPERANLFRKLLHLRTIHETIREAHSLKGGFSLERRLDEASIETLGCTVQDLCINMEFIPQSTSETNDWRINLLDVYPWESPGTFSIEEPAEPISNANFTIYIRRTLEYCLDKGIRAQMDAFKAGIDRVFSMSWLSVFTSIEVGRLISGASGVSWTREELLAYTSPTLGYTKSSPAFLLLIDVLVAFDTGERRKFLRFISGSSSLPVGGLKNLNPRLRIVCKDPSEGPYPSVNTCAHYLKLPEYSSAKELRHYLVTAMEQTGFYLN